MMPDNEDWVSEQEFPEAVVDEMLDADEGPDHSDEDD